MNRKLGLVCEGKSDFIVLEHLLRDHFGSQGVNLSFRWLQPHTDATGRLGEGGWRLVFQWCLRNVPTQREALFSSDSIFSISEDEAINVLIIHLDADICEEIKRSDLESIARIRDMDTDTPDQRASFIRACLVQWLGIDEESLTESKHVFAIPVESTEAWLIAHEIEENVERIVDIGVRSAEIIYAALDIRLPSDRKIKKKPAIFQRYIDQSPVAARMVADKCARFAEFIEQTSAQIER